MMKEKMDFLSAEKSGRVERVRSVWDVVVDVVVVETE